MGEPNKDSLSTQPGQSQASPPGESVGADEARQPDSPKAATARADRAVNSAASAIASIRADVDAESQAELGALAGQIDAAQKKAAGAQPQAAPTTTESLAAIDAQLSSSLDKLDLDFGSVEEVLNDVFESESSAARERKIDRAAADAPAQTAKPAGQSDAPPSAGSVKDQTSRLPSAAPSVSSKPALSMDVNKASPPPASTAPGGPAEKPLSMDSVPAQNAEQIPRSEPAIEAAVDARDGHIPATAPPPSTSAAHQPARSGKAGLLTRLSAALKPPAIQILVLMNAPLKYVPAAYRPYVDWLAISLAFWVPIVWGMVLLFG